MAIIQSLPCPACQETGHDTRGDHLMLFEDGGKFCNKSHFHKSGAPYFEAAGETKDVSEWDINGKIKYTQAQFKELIKAGRLDSPQMRALAMSGMRGEDRWEVSNDEERAAQQKIWDADRDFFYGLKIKNLISRHILGQYAKLYDVRVGHNAEGEVSRHYYPVFQDGVWVGAKCRTLPKDFAFGHLGRMWGPVDFFGMNTVQAVMDSGTRKYKLMIVGGECDAMAAQQMLVESAKGTNNEGRLQHVWSITKGEMALQQIMQHRQQIDQFAQIIFAFDGDDVGRKLVRECSRLFPGKAFTLTYPQGCKDPNDCLKQGKSKEFVDAWFNPAEAASGSKVKSVKNLSDLAKKRIEQGISWPWPGMDAITLGIRPYQLYLFGAGSGVGKTATSKDIAHHLIEEHGEMVGVIYTEEPANMTVRSYAGRWIGKRLELPPCNDKSDPTYSEGRDYTHDQADEAIDSLSDRACLFVAVLDGDTSISNVMATVEEMLSMGIRHIIIDNLTGITLDKGKGTKVEAIDEAMKTIGNFKDSNPVTIYLYSHLIKPDPNKRVPHEQGGPVFIDDFRGAGSIKFWANYAFGIRRNVMGETLEEKCSTYIDCLKDRDQGIHTGDTVALLGNPNTGVLRELTGMARKAPTVKERESPAAKDNQSEPASEPCEF